MYKTKEDLFKDEAEIEKETQNAIRAMGKEELPASVLIESKNESLKVAYKVERDLRTEIEELKEEKVPGNKLARILYKLSFTLEEWMRILKKIGSKKYGRRSNKVVKKDSGFRPNVESSL